MSKKIISISTLIGVFSVIALLQGCVTVPSDNIKRTFSPTYHIAKVTDYPTVGEIKTIEVGESLVYKDKQISIPAIDIEQVIEQNFTNFGKTYLITILPGRYVEREKTSTESTSKHLLEKRLKMAGNCRKELAFMLQTMTLERQSSMPWQMPQRHCPIREREFLLLSLSNKPATNSA